MKSLGFVAVGLLMWLNAAPAQTTQAEAPSASTASSGGSADGVLRGGLVTHPEYVPQTASERFRSYLFSAFGPGAIGRAVAGGSISQWDDSPKEWGGGAAAWGERIGSAYAEHGIRKTLEFGAASALHEDDRYFRSDESGFWKRTRHAIASTFTARDYAGNEHLSFTRVGSAAGASFISRIWQPRSETTAGDGAVNFGITMAAEMGWNVFKEFSPIHAGRH